MSEEEWLRCSETNPMFAATEPPAEVQLATFNLACCRRIRHLITDDVVLRALEALEISPGHTTVPAELALEALEVTSGGLSPTSPLYNPARNWSAVKAVGHAVCRSLPPGSLQYWSDARENARMVALYCQWAVGWAADPDSDADAEDPYGDLDNADPGLMYLRRTAQQAEASAQCDLIRRLFKRAAEPVVAPDPRRQ
jgi:hypothetical protein